MIFIDKGDLFVFYAIEEVAILNPDYTSLTISPVGFLHFVRNTHAQANFFGSWKSREKKVFNYNNTAFNLDIYIVAGTPNNRAYLTGKDKPTIEIGLVE